MSAYAGRRPLERHPPNGQFTRRPEPTAQGNRRQLSANDLADLQHNTRDGLHIASLAGAWNALVPRVPVDSSSMSSLMSLPFVTLIIVCPDCGSPEAASD